MTERTWVRFLRVQIRADLYELFFTTTYSSLQCKIKNSLIATRCCDVVMSGGSTVQGMDHNKHYTIRKGTQQLSGLRRCIKERKFMKSKKHLTFTTQHARAMFLIGSLKAKSKYGCYTPISIRPPDQS